MVDLETAEEIAERLRVKPQTVKGWAHEGHIPVVRLTPKVVRYNPEAVIKALVERQQNKREGSS